MKIYLLGFIASILLYSCGSQEQMESNEYDGPMLISEDIDVVYTDSARLKLVLKAKKQIKLRNENEEFPEGIYLDFYDDNEVKETTLTSDYALHDQQKKHWFVKGNVVLNNFVQNRTLRSEELYWSSEKKEIWCDTSVRVIVKTEDQTLYGKGLKAKDDFSDYEIYQPTGSFEL